LLEGGEGTGQATSLQGVDASFRPPPLAPATKAAAAIPGVFTLLRHAAATAPGANVLPRNPLPALFVFSRLLLLPSNRNADYSVHKLLERMTTVHPIKMQPPPESGFITPLHHYQKQSLAFMVDAKRMASRGGWLCDKVGMGKIRFCDSFLLILSLLL
jgi:hypothetical protein